MFHKQNLIQEANIIIQNEHKIKYCCAPSTHDTQCKGNIIKAHSISKCLGLNEIKNQHSEVYYLKPYSNLYSLEKAQGKFLIEKINIKSASTASMFCQIHDKNLFQPIEDKEFIINKENCFLLTYRSVSLEFFKTNNKSFIPSSKQNDISTLKDKLDYFLIHNEFDQINHYIIEVKENNLLTSSIYTPCVNFQNQIIQDANSDDNLIPIIINSIRTGKKGYIIFSFEKNNTNFIEKYLKGLISLPNFKQSQVLTNIFFKTFENNFWNISWWDKLEKKRQNELLNYMQPLQTTDTPKSYVDFAQIIERNNRRFNKVLKRSDQPGFYVQQGYYLK